MRQASVSLSSGETAGDERGVLTKLLSHCFYIFVIPDFHAFFLAEFQRFGQLDFGDHGGIVFIQESPRSSRLPWGRRRPSHPAYLV